MTEVGNKAAKSKPLSAKKSAKPGEKFKSFKTKTGKFGKNNTSKGKDTSKKQKVSKHVKKASLGSSMEVDESLPMEYGFDELMETSGNEKTDNRDKITKKALKESQENTKRKPSKAGKESKKKSADEKGAATLKAGLKRKSSDDEEETKPKKAKMLTNAKSKSKKEQLDEAPFKERKKARKMLNKNYELGSQSKQLWEQLRRFDLTAERRQEICEELFNLVKNRMHILIFAHDTSRVIQSLVKYGSKEHRDAIFSELKDRLREIMMSKYAKFFIRKMLKYGKKEQRNHVFQQLSGHFRKLMKHKEAGQLVEIIYNDFANVTQRRAIVEEFYGKTFRLFKSEEVKTIEDAIKADPSKREVLLSSLKKTLTVLTSKSILTYSVVHHLFLEYFSNADEAMRADMIETTREGLVHMLHTRDGSRVAMTGLWHGTAKDRKVIVKSFKTYVAKICKEEHSHLVMLSLFDVVDDTKLVQKAILDELIKSIDELAKDEYGRKVLLYLLAPRDPNDFHPDIVAILQKGDGNAHSKKESETRRQELCQYISKPLLQWVVDNCQSIVSNNALLHLTSVIMKHTTADSTAAMQAIAGIAAKPFTPSSDCHLVDHTAGHLTLKHIIADDARRVASSEAVLFSNILLDTVPKDRLLSWLTSNRGCFVLVSMLETGIKDVVTRVTDLLSGVKSTLKQQKFAGAQVLLKKLNQPSAAAAAAAAAATTD